MTKFKLLAETEKTVTLKRRDYQALLDAAEDRADLAAVASHRSHEKSVGWDVARRDYLTRAEASRALAGEHPVRIWRQKRGMTQRALAEAAHVSASYLTEIETGKKPGSADALRRLASVLETAMEALTRG
jgi:DNA-binding XRE family transcriptional regulator